ncbi:MAG TPA: 3-dehydroquinate synthase [Vicinamibacterales bacterium]|nr:3-dehydroquinate synthase [Vicinamibacterales bacterium]
MTPIRFEVSSAYGAYAVVIGPGVVREVDVLTRPFGRSRLIVSADPIWRRHGRHLRSIAGRRGPALVPDGERAKSLATVARLYDVFVERSLDRASTIIAFGGGVLGDLTGFAAATYLRGVAFVQVPTTLVAQVDSAIGGKVGVNLAAGKNLVGAFYPPRLVVCDPTLLSTLPRREFRAGLYEVVKYGVIASRPLFDRVSTGLDLLFRQDAAALNQVIADCCALKVATVVQDEREAGPRRILNFGHTIGHALEAVTRYRRLLHGEAVGYGMLAAARLSAARGLLGADDEAALGDLIRRMGPLPAVGDLSAARVIDAIGHDKKVVNGTLHFVLATAIGATSMATDVTTTEIRRALRHIGLRA